MKVGSKILGIAVGQKSFLVAEVVSKGDRHVVSHCAEFAFPEGLSLSTPDKLGEAFRQFLRGKQILTKDVVIGLPAKRLVTRRKEVPPATPAVAASTLRLQAEGEFSSELDNLVMDFAGTPSPAETTTVLLIATNKVVVDECDAMAKAAGLRVAAITSTTAALGRATSRLPGGDGLVLSIGPGGAELVVQHGSDPAHLKHLNMLAGNEAINALAGEIRRTMAAIPRNGTPQTMAVWTTGLQENPQSILEQRLSMPVTRPEIANLAATETPNTEGYAPAVALALSALETDGLPVDFLHSRMAPPKAPAVSMTRQIVTASLCALVAIGGLMYWDLSSKQSAVSSLQAELTANKKTIADANTQIKNAAYAKEWLPKSPIQIEVLRDVTNVVLEKARGSNTLWATGLGNIRDAFTWEMEGKSVNSEFPQVVVDAMINDHSDRFSNAKLQTMQYEQQTNLWQFKISFTYIPEVKNKPRTVATSQPTNNRSTGRTNTGNNGNTGNNTPNNTGRNNGRNNNTGNTGNTGGANPNGGGGRNATANPNDFTNNPNAFGAGGGFGGGPGGGGFGGGPGGGFGGGGAGGFGGGGRGGRGGGGFGGPGGGAAGGAAGAGAVDVGGAEVDPGAFDPNLGDGG